VGVTGPFGTVTWEYDAFSRRVKQHDTAPAGPEIVRDLIWEGLSIIESRNQATGEIRRYYGNGEERQLAAAVTRLHYSTDHLGSIRELTDATGTIRARYDYDPYGNVTKLSGDLDTDFGYTGHYYHAASGLHLAPYRGYNPKLGRWLSRDPIGEEGGINLYGYVLNNPLSLVDPFGLDNLNLINPNDTKKQGGMTKAFVDAAPLDPNVYSVAAHGTAAIMEDENGKPISPEKLAERIKKDPKYNPAKMTVRLYACSTGGYTNDGAANYAQRLADALGNTVYAPTKNIHRSSETKGLDTPFGRFNETTTYYCVVRNNGTFVPHFPRRK
jgi:RHS repeat-associated protein